MLYAICKKPTIVSLVYYLLRMNMNMKYGNAVIITSAKEVMFLPDFVCLFVCLSVCLCVSKITEKVMDGSF